MDSTADVGKFLIVKASCAAVRGAVTFDPGAGLVVAAAGGAEMTTTACTRPGARARPARSLVDPAGACWSVTDTELADTFSKEAKAAPMTPLKLEFEMKEVTSGTFMFMFTDTVSIGTVVVTGAAVVLTVEVEV